MIQQLKTVVAEATVCAVLTTGAAIAADAQATTTNVTPTDTKTIALKPDLPPCPVVPGQPVRAGTPQTPSAAQQTQADARQAQIDAQQAQRAQRDAQSHGGGILGGVIRGADAANALSNIHWGHKKPDPKPVAAVKPADCDPSKTPVVPMTTATTATATPASGTPTAIAAKADGAPATPATLAVKVVPSHLLPGTGPKNGNVTAGLTGGDTRKKLYENGPSFSVPFQIEGSQGLVQFGYISGDFEPHIMIQAKGGSFPGSEAQWDKNGALYVEVGDSYTAGITGRLIKIEGYGPYSAELQPPRTQIDGAWKPTIHIDNSVANGPTFEEATQAYFDRTQQTIALQKKISDPAALTSDTSAGAGPKPGTDRQPGTSATKPDLASGLTPKTSGKSLAGKGMPELIDEGNGKDFIINYPDGRQVDVVRSDPKANLYVQKDDASHRYVIGRNDAGAVTSFRDLGALASQTH